MPVLANRTVRGPAGGVPGATGLVRVTIADVLWLAMAGAVVAALVQVASVEFRFRVLHVLTWTSREFALLSLAGNLAIFLAGAVPVIALVVFLRRWVGLRAVATIFASLAAFAVLLLVQEIHPAAQLVLAVGLGFRVGGLVAAAPARSMRLVRRGAVGGAAVVVVMGLVAVAGQRLGAWSIRRQAVAAAEGAPNILLLILDTVRAANLSLYGYPRPTTPVLDRLSAESTVFDFAFAAAPWTAPSHASMMTGVWASQTGADYLHPMYDSLPTVAELLGRHGFATGGFMANTGFAGYQVGLSRGFDHYEDFPVSFLQAIWSTTLAQTGSGRLLVDGLREGARWKVREAFTRPDLRVLAVRKSQMQTAADIVDNFLGWRAGVGGRPYFAMLNFMDAHGPYEPPDGFQTRFNEGRREIDRYDGGIAYLDSIVGSLVDRLRTRGDLDRTFVIVTSDHGELWGEHEFDGHGNTLYLPVLHVPLLIRAPGRAPAGERIGSVVSLRDLAATLADLAGASPSLPGSSLAGAWGNDPAGGVSPVLAEAAMAVNPGARNPTRFGPIKSTLDSTWHYIRYGDGTETLFAWRDDPAELEDRATTAEGPAVIERQRRLISRLLGTGWPPPRSRLH